MKLPKILLAAALVAGLLTGCSARATLTVLGPWSDAEEQSFRAVFADFEAEHNVTIDYIGTPAVNQVLQADVQKGQPPDVAVLTSPGELARYAASGGLRKIAGVSDSEYSQQWRTLLRLGTPDLYAVPVKADLKSIVWYNAHTPPSPVPSTWPGLLDYTAKVKPAWCLGMEAYSTSGWPGTDWIEDILLHQAGPDTYADWASGKLSWKSDAVRAAWTTWGQLLAAQGAPGLRTAALLTYFGDAGKQMFATQPGCHLEHQGSFATGSYPKDAAADFFPFPTIGPVPESWEVSVNLAGQFTDNPLAADFMAYLAGARAQAVWPARQDSSAFSVNQQVLAASVYKGPVRTHIAQVLASAQHLCLDASDVMPAAMADAFSRAVLEFLGDPSRLTDILSGLDNVRTGVAGQGKLTEPCG
ncbi:ABC transporter substrate-binding protein [Kutzneria chonburiensis]|uniref:ABC transporter substrate-binding protein n=1 Tax=Kutzneria chonburiensis TaxID=1483604 RepID=A0ABV6MS11_9PSEU|nr:extracellular solute-binding protein [Kutzneria chonburiensis]